MFWVFVGCCFGVFWGVYVVFDCCYHCLFSVFSGVLFQCLFSVFFRCSLYCLFSMFVVVIQCVLFFFNCLIIAFSDFSFVSMFFLYVVQVFPLLVNVFQEWFLITTWHMMQYRFLTFFGFLAGSTNRVFCWCFAFWSPLRV